jgi:hypothetical protein
MNLYPSEWFVTATTDTDSNLPDIFKQNYTVMNKMIVQCSLPGGQEPSRLEESRMVLAAKITWHQAKILHPEPVVMPPAPDQRRIKIIHVK